MDNRLAEERADADTPESAGVDVSKRVPGVDLSKRMSKRFSGFMGKPKNKPDDN